MIHLYLKNTIILIFVLLITMEYTYAKVTYSISIKHSNIQIPEIRKVSVSEDNKIIIEWNVIKNPNIKSVNLYRSENNDSTNLQLIRVSLETEQNKFIDENVNPQDIIYHYTISIIDYCKNETFNENTQNTILLKITKTHDNFNKLEWNKSLNSNSNYVILRGESLDKMFIIESIDNSNYLYIDNYIGNSDLYYRIETTKFNKANNSYFTIKSNTFQVSNSNVACIYDEKIKIYPNPITFDFQIVFPSYIKNNCNLIITDLLGKIIINKPIDTERMVFGRDIFVDGLYLVHIIGKNVNYTDRIIIGGIN